MMIIVFDLVFIIELGIYFPESLVYLNRRKQCHR